MEGDGKVPQKMSREERGDGWEGGSGMGRGRKKLRLHV